MMAWVLFCSIGIENWNKWETQKSPVRYRDELFFIRLENIRADFKYIFVNCNIYVIFQFFATI
jgi:hypothetical protein